SISSARLGHDGAGPTDHDALTRPNLALATWVTSVLLGYSQRGGGRGGHGGGDSFIDAAAGLPTYLFMAWSVGLRSANMTLKLMAASVAGAILQGMAFGGGGIAGGDGAGAGQPVKLLLPPPLRPRRKKAIVGRADRSRAIPRRLSWSSAEANTPLAAAVSRSPGSPGSPMMAALPVAFPGAPTPLPAPEAVGECLALLPVARLHALALRRAWSERASQPVCSRYLQGLVELSATLRLVAKYGVGGGSSGGGAAANRDAEEGTKLVEGFGAGSPDAGASAAFPSTPTPLLTAGLRDAEAAAAAADAAAVAVEPYESVADPAMPQALPPASAAARASAGFCREWDEGLVLSDGGWELWSGRIVQRRVRWEERRSRRGALAMPAAGRGGGGGGGTAASDSG
ncbi:unnamed protein product, partial [Phaeothamnion confervicola]